MEKYYVMVNGQQDGPFTQEEVISKGYSSDSYIYNKNLGSWKKISEVLDISSDNKENPNIETKTNSDKSNQTNSESPYKSSNIRKQKMFSNPFSFNGRIRRMEYGISYIIYLISIQVVAELSIDTTGLIILYIPLIWFLIAQGTKRCHDVGKSGGWQFIPFYVFWLIFQEGKTGSNEYGPNPK